MYQYELNIFAIVMLVSLLIVVYLTIDSLSFKDKLFRRMVFTVILMNILEILSWIFDGKPGELNYFLNSLFNFLFIGLNTLIVAFFALYIDYIIFNDYKRLKKRIEYYFPLIIVFILSIINLFYPILFKIDSNNIYHRLPLLWISMPLLFIEYIYIFYLANKNTKAYKKRVVLGVLVFALMPIIGAVIQLLNYGLNLIWPSTALAILIIYLIFETTSNSRDYLTNLYTRARAEEQITALLQKKKSFSVLMIDINHFKNVNDTYGHNYGDQVLIFVSEILKQELNINGVVARFGGDEFIIVTEITDTGILDNLLQIINKKIKTHKFENKINLEISYGVSTCYQSEECSVEEIIIAADKRMYEYKRNQSN